MCFTHTLLQAVEFTKNIYMYDNDGTSSYITSNILRIDIKSLDNRITPGVITFEQIVITPLPTFVSPNETVVEDDASEFVYHRFVYGKATDYVCMILQPLGIYTFTSYTLYFRLTEPPTIQDYDFTLTIDESDNWQKCIAPSLLAGHTGLTYYAVHVPGTG